MSDDEFSDFSDDQPTIIQAKGMESLEHTIMPEIKDAILTEIKDASDTEKKVQDENKIILDETLLDKTKEKDELSDIINKNSSENLNVLFPLQWLDYKKVENDILKTILILCWVEEKFVVRASLKYIIEKDNVYEYTSNVYNLKNYKENTEDFLPKLSLVFIIFNILEKCPFEELYDCKSMLYISKMFKKSSKDLLFYFSKGINSKSILEKCLGYYALIFLEHPLNRNIEHFVELEKYKKSLETMLV
jgi:hypothetical protein